MIAAPLNIYRAVDMYGCCKDVCAHVGSQSFGRQHGDAHWCASQRIWYVSIFNRDGSTDEYQIFDGTVEQVEALYRLTYRSNYAASQSAARFREAALNNFYSAERRSGVDALTANANLHEFAKRFDALQPAE